MALGDVIEEPSSAEKRYNREENVTGSVNQ
jgi:hypothetical protein